MSDKRVNIDIDNCIFCWSCVNDCPEDVFNGLEAYVYDYINQEQLYVYLYKCNGCMNCENSCPTDALYFTEISNSGGGSSSGSGWTHPKLKFSPNMPEELIQKIISNIAEREDCTSQKLLNADITYNFVYDNSVGFFSTYNAATKTIQYGNQSASSRELISHEMFHAYQDSVYPGGIGEFKKSEPGYINLEFEQYVFQNIAFYQDSYFLSIGTQFRDETIKAEFKDWIYLLNNDNTSNSKCPGVSPTSEFTAKYTYFLEKFNEYGPTGYKSIILDLPPNALYEFFK